MKQKKQQSFHSFYQNLIKMKSGASFVSWEQYKDKYSLKVIRDKKTHHFDIEGTPQDVTAENYMTLLNSITNGGQV